jgi:cold-inducible RNA-binding protein
MPSELFIAQLDWSVTEEELDSLFSQYGEVASVRIPTDKMTGKKRGFAFVAMANPEQAQAAIQALNQWDLKGRALVVKLAEPKPSYTSEQGGANRGGYGNRGNQGGYSNSRY